MGKREVGSIWRAIFGDGEETQAQKDAKSLGRWFSGEKTEDYTKYIEPREEARRRRWEEEERKREQEEQSNSYVTEKPDISEEEYSKRIDEALSFFSPGWGKKEDDDDKDKRGFGWW